MVSSWSWVGQLVTGMGILYGHGIGIVSVGPGGKLHHFRYIIMEEHFRNPSLHCHQPVPYQLPFSSLTTTTSRAFCHGAAWIHGSRDWSRSPAHLLLDESGSVFLQCNWGGSQTIQEYSRESTWSRLTRGEGILLSFPNQQSHNPCLDLLRVLCDTSVMPATPRTC